MKRIILSAIALASIAICTVVALKTIQKSNDLISFISGDVEALTYVTENPGPQGQRQKQAVLCCEGDWKVREGCCYGGENCTYVYCREPLCFTCDTRDGWVQL